MIKVPVCCLVGVFLIFAAPIAVNAEASRAPECGEQVESQTNDTDVTIPSGPGVVTSTITIAGASPYIWDVDVFTKISHTFNSDLDITITSPAGTSVTLTSDNGGSSDNVFLGTVWDDSANPDGQIPYAKSGGNSGLVTDTAYANLVIQPHLVPEEPLAAFIGEDPNGVWTLTISDDLAADSGLLDSWTLQLTTIPAAPVMSIYPKVTNSTEGSIPDGDASPAALSTVNLSSIQGRICDLEVRVKLNHTASGDIQASLTAPSGKIVTLTSNNGGASDNVFADTVFSNSADLGNVAPFTSNTFAASNLVTDTTYANLTNKEILVPEESLGLFNGDDANGTWSLRVADSNPGEVGVLKGWSLTVRTCRPLVDTDNDSFGDSCDACPLDAQKIAPGECGCGVRETDLNANGILDCKFNDEIRFKIDSLHSQVDGLKPAKGKAARQVLKDLRAAVAAAVADLEQYTSAGGVVVSVQANADFSALRKTAAKKILAARKALTAKSRKRAGKALDNMRAALV